MQPGDGGQQICLGFLDDLWTEGRVVGRTPAAAPDFWQHQLDGLPVEKKLDANVFAAKIDEFLSQIPTAPVASTTGVAAPKSE